jgi:hypothetical protein
MAWTVIVAKPAQKQTARFPAKDQAKIKAGIGIWPMIRLLAMSSSWRAETTAGAVVLVITGYSYS